MRYDKDSIEYIVNLQALKEMEEIVPMTLRERRRIRCWAGKGHDIESNPWDYRDEYGYPLNFLEAYRLFYGYSSGPWDFWKGPEEQLLWDKSSRCFLPKDNLD